MSSFGNTSEPNPTQLVSFSIQVRKPKASEILSFHDVKSMTGKLGNHLSDLAKTSLSASCESLGGGGGGDLPGLGVLIRQDSKTGDPGAPGGAGTELATCCLSNCIC